ncbi:MAG: hypothetical protein Q4B63_03485 [Clostridium perfringens]|nr:hypothetical protein [Clostridium perfringens]
MKKKKLRIFIGIFIAAIIIVLITISIALTTNPTLTYLQNTDTTITKATNALIKVQENISLNSSDALIYNQGDAYEYGQQFQNIWNDYDQNDKDTPSISDYYTKVQTIETQEKLAYNLLTSGVTLYLNGSTSDKTTGVAYIEKAYSILNILNKETVPNTINNFQEEINKIQT